MWFSPTPSFSAFHKNRVLRLAKAIGSWSTPVLSADSQDTMTQRVWCSERMFWWRKEEMKMKWRSLFLAEPQGVRGPKHVTYCVPLFCVALMSPHAYNFCDVVFVSSYSFELQPPKKKDEDPMYVLEELSPCKGWVLVRGPKARMCLSVFLQPWETHLEGMQLQTKPALTRNTTRINRLNLICSPGAVHGKPFSEAQTTST